MNIQTIQVLKNLLFAVIFGALFWLFLELIQSAFVNSRFSCCERCGNILFDAEQTILAFCAALSFFAVSFLKINGWKGVLKTLAVSFLCFQIYFLMTKWNASQSAECAALDYPRGSPLFLNEFVMEIFTGFWSIICAAALIAYQQILRSLSTR